MRMHRSDPRRRLAPGLHGPARLFASQGRLGGAEGRTRELRTPPPASHSAHPPGPANAAALYGTRGLKGTREPRPRRHFVVFSGPSRPRTWRVAAEAKAPPPLPARPVPAGRGPQTRDCPLAAFRARPRPPPPPFPPLQAARPRAQPVPSVTGREWAGLRVCGVSCAHVALGFKRGHLHPCTQFEQ